MYTILIHIKDALSGIAGINTCRIGLENGISPDDYPLIRIQPTVSQHGAALPRKKVSVDIYFGLNIAESDEEGLEGIYAAMDPIQSAIVTALESSQLFTAVWEDTIYDMDRFDPDLKQYYKLAMSRFTVVA